MLYIPEYSRVEYFWEYLDAILWLNHVVLCVAL